MENNFNVNSIEIKDKNNEISNIIKIKSNSANINNLYCICIISINEDEQISNIIKDVISEIKF